MEGEAGKVEAGGQLHRRRVTLADGRYLIFYTFGDEGEEARGAVPRPEPEPRPEAEEERGV